METSAEASPAQSGWRQDRPREDPEKMKRWGWISAMPSEYLIHYRDGKLRQRSSGQGATCFKLPSDSVAIVPTTIKEISFSANQITRDNVDVRIRGMAVFRINDPLRIYRLINFSFRERAEQKLSATIAEMCRSHAKWLVANMPVEECIRKRKEEIGATLKKEVERVVSGGNEEGGWGVVIEAIDIQDVFIVSDEIYQSLQEEYKNRARLAAEHSRLLTQRELRNREIEQEKEILLQELASRRETREQEIELERRDRALQIEAETGNRLEEIQAEQQIQATDEATRIQELERESKVRRHALRLEQEELEARLAFEEEKARRESERDRLLLDLQKQMEEIRLALDLLRVRENNRIALEKTRAEAERTQLLSEQSLHDKELELRAEVMSHDEGARFRRMIREIDNAISDAHLRELFMVQSLPEIARAFSAQFERIQYTHLGSGETPLAPIAGAFLQLLEVAKGHGIDLAALLNNKK